MHTTTKTNRYLLFKIKDVERDFGSKKLNPTRGKGDLIYDKVEFAALA